MTITYILVAWDANELVKLNALIECLTAISVQCNFSGLGIYLLHLQNCTPALYKRYSQQPHSHTYCPCVPDMLGIYHYKTYDKLHSVL